jgi:hypothetical protein
MPSNLDLALIGIQRLYDNDLHNKRKPIGKVKMRIWQNAASPPPHTSASDYIP